MKNDSGDFGYDPAVPSGSRVHCRTNAYGPPPGSQMYTPHLSHSGDGLQYRQNPLPAYPYSLKYYPMAYFGEGDDNVDFGIQASGYSLMNTAPLSSSISYNANSGRGWTPAPQQSKTSPLFMEQDSSSYSNAQLPYQSTSYALRPSLNLDPKSLSLNGTASSLSAHASGTDRVLPHPATNRPTAAISIHRSGETSFHGSQNQSSVQCNSVSLPSANMINSVASLKALGNTLSAPENGPMSAPSYLSIPSNSPKPVPSSMSYIQGHTSNEHSDKYDNYASASHEGLYNHANSSSNSIAYSHCEPTQNLTRHDSQGSATNEGSHHLLSSSSGHLVNGQIYQPQPYTSQSSYPAPPIIELQPSGTVVPRHSVST
jgi:hypothetical protein